MAGGRDQLDMLEADALQVVGNHFRGLENVGFVFLRGADTGNAEKIFQLADEALLIFTSVGDGWGGHMRSP
jgi:hypothetical protein